jgi:hypothetical protein
MGGLARFAPLIAVVAGAAVIAPAPAGAATGMEVAVQDDIAFVEQAGSARTAAVLNAARELNATRIRANVLWSTAVGPSAKSTVRPTPVHYDFSAYDRALNDARMRGIKLQLTITGPAPAWAAGDRKVGVYKPNAKLFGEFVTAVAEHFRGLVDRYSIWNEPNHIGWLKPLKSQGKLYRSLYKAGWAALQRVDPGAQVLIGETAPYVSRKGQATPPLQFLREVLCADERFDGEPSCALTADGFAHHPYDFDHKPTFKFPGKDNVTLATLGRLTTALDTLARGGILSNRQGRPLDLYLTEYGFFASGKRKLKPATHAKYLVQGFKMANANGRVREMLQYLMVQAVGKYAFFDTGIMDRNANRGPAFNALAAWARDAVGAGKIAGFGAP